MKKFIIIILAILGLIALGKIMPILQDGTEGPEIREEQQTKTK